MRLVYSPPKGVLGEYTNCEKYIRERGALASLESTVVAVCCKPRMVVGIDAMVLMGSGSLSFKQMMGPQGGTSQDTEMQWA